MPSRSSGSTVVRRRLGHALRNLREDANIRIEAAARELECSTAKISRLENGLGPAKKLEVRALLDLYDVHDAERRAEFDRWADGTKSTGWWESDSDLTSDDDNKYLAIETESSLLRMYCTPVFPAILRTPEYSRAYMRTWYPELVEDDVARLADLRLQRQTDLLSADHPLRVDVVVDEAALHRRVGSAATHSEQLKWLVDTLDGLDSAGRSDIDFRIFPFVAGIPDRAMSAFTLLTPRQPDLDPMTAFVEDSSGAVWVETADDIAALEAMFERLSARSLDPATSRDLLRSVVT